MSSLPVDQQRWKIWIFLGVVAASLADRIYLLWRFGFQHTGSDDVLFWEVARDMAEGIFREPYLYGQNYNPALESLLAVPLLWASIPFHVALPIITSLLALVPFLSFAWWHHRQDAFGIATLFAAIPLLLPVEWGLMTMITRGFVTGLALLAMLPWLSMIRDERLRAILTGAVLYAALFVNPNALLFAAPYFLWSVVHSTTPFRNFLLGVSGAMPILGLHAAAHWFYVARPERVVHRLDDWRMTFYPGELIPEALGQLDAHLAWIAPIWWPNGQLVLWAIAGVATALLLNRRWKAGVAVASVLPIVLLSFGFPKVHDAHQQVFYPYARMYLALPLVLAWSITLLPSRRGFSNALLMAIAAMAPVFLAVKVDRTNAVIAAQLAGQHPIPVREVTMGTLREDVHYLKEAATNSGAELIVCFDHPDKFRSRLLVHGGPCLQPDLPPTLYVGVDRRWWRRQEEREQVRESILFIGGTADEWRTTREQFPAMDVLLMGKDSVRLIRSAGLPLDELLVRMGRHID